MTQKQADVFNTLHLHVMAEHVAGICTDDCIRLSADICTIDTDEPAWRGASASALYGEWLRRVGGWVNVPSYLASLKAGDARRFKPEDSVDRAERALGVQ